jgi:hypothetical protein
MDAGPRGNGTLGGTCRANSDCVAGLSCIKSSDDLGARPGGVGNGLCTADCTVNANACAAFGGICVAIDITSGGAVTKATCFESCAIGPNPPGAPAFKCHGRLDAACEPLNQAETLFGCVPLCVTDADCGSRKCDAASGLCVDAPMTGKPLGSGCTIVRGELNTECAGGLCLPIDSAPDASTSNPGICTALCRLGTQEACGYRVTPLDAGPPVGACVLPWGDTGYNTGDLGLCLQLCDVAGDCRYQASNWTCRTDIVLNGFGHSICLTPRPD